VTVDAGCRLGVRAWVPLQRSSGCRTICARSSLGRTISSYTRTIAERSSITLTIARRWSSNTHAGNARPIQPSPRHRPQLSCRIRLGMRLMRVRAGPSTTNDPISSVGRFVSKSMRLSISRGRATGGYRSSRTPMAGASTANTSSPKSLSSVRSTRRSCALRREPNGLWLRALRRARRKRRVRPLAPHERSHRRNSRRRGRALERFVSCESSVLRVSRGRRCLPRNRSRP